MSKFNTVWRQPMTTEPFHDLTPDNWCGVAQTIHPETMTCQ